MKRLILLTSLILYTTAFTQITDTVKTEVKAPEDSISVQSDTLTTPDSSLAKAKPDSIKALQYLPLTSKSYLLKRTDLLMSEYKYTGDYLRLFPFNFIKDLGFTGQPNETFLYGLGNSSISFLLDGISNNERYYNSLNLNLLQSEDIDSIEVLPLPRGFLYGNYNNPVSINFITRDFITSQPYSRIRYYQGPNRETMLDGIFNLRMTSRLITTFEITNRIVDSTFDNSEFSIWQGKIKLKYLLSNDVNIIASYNYNDYKAGYSGGIDVDSIRRTGANINNILYDPVQAPVIFPNGKVAALTHLPRLRLLVKQSDWLRNDISFYYFYSKNENNSFVNESIKDKVFGVDIKNLLKYDVFDIKLNLAYENSDIFRQYSFYDPNEAARVYAPPVNFKYKTLSATTIISTKIGNDLITPSVFYKFSSVTKYPGRIIIEDSSSNVSTGLGFDVSVKANDFFDFYFGSSVFKSYYSDKNNLLLEAGVKFTSNIFTANLRYFKNQYNYEAYTGGNFFDYIQFGDVNGLGLNLKLDLWKILIESNSSYYKKVSNNLIGVPEVQTQTGVYYKNLVFDDNLDLKTGFVFYYTGKNNVYTFEHGLLSVPSSKKVDFTLAGEIQKRAIVYFLWQNIFDNNYYITPYYPMPGRSIRFGVAWELFN